MSNVAVSIVSRAGLVVLFLLAATGSHSAVCAQQPGRSTDTSMQLAHSDHEFEFTIKAPMGIVAPLFGAEKERAWAPGWDPQFVWPQPASDRQGMVFKIAHHDKTAIWVNTRYEPQQGRFQYTYVIPDVLVTVITIDVARVGNASTHVAVEYQRTALAADANEVVQHMGQADSESGPKWQQQIESYLAKAAK